MTNESLKNELTKLALSEGAGDLGFADLSPLQSFSQYKSLCRGYPSALSVVVPLSHGILLEMIDQPTITYFAHYRAVNRFIDQLTLRLSLLLESRGYKSFAIPASQSDPEDEYAGVFPHKTAAVLAGLGAVGKNALLMHRDFGSAVRLGTVLTELPVSPAKVLDAPCGNCTLCRDHCPAMAIEGHPWKPGVERSALIDVRACSLYMKSAYQNIGRGVVCGLCMTHCPFSGIRGNQRGFSDET